MSDVKFVTVKYGSVKNNRNFAVAMGKLMGLETGTKTAYNLKRIKDGVTSKVPTIKKEYNEEIVQKFSARNEDGTLRSNPQNPDAFVPDEKSFSEFLEAEKAFGEKMFTLDGRHQIPAYYLPAGAQFTSLEIEALEGIIDWSSYDEQAPQGFSTAEAALGGNVVPMSTPVQTDSGVTDAVGSADAAL